MLNHNILNKIFEESQKFNTKKIFIWSYPENNIIDYDFIIIGSNLQTIRNKIKNYKINRQITSDNCILTNLSLTARNYILNNNPINIIPIEDENIIVFRNKI